MVKYYRKQEKAFYQIVTKIEGQETTGEILQLLVWKPTNLVP